MKPMYKAIPMVWWSSPLYLFVGSAKKWIFFRNFPLKRGGGRWPLSFFLPKFVGPKKVLGRF